MNFAYISIVVPSGKPIGEPDYCVIKFSVGDEPGTLVRALKVFHVSLIKFCDDCSNSYLGKPTMYLCYEILIVYLLALS